MEKDLWNRVQEFDLDHPISEYGFSTRLADENFWTIDFTKKAILEYKKFMYLAATSTMMISPSEIVDSVWHQHLIFTQSYTDFCRLLGKDIQHIPSTHNREEAEKFKAAKERTQKHYKVVFGEQPAEIWDYSGMLDTLNLPKARINVRSSLLIGLIGTCLIFPLVFLSIKPVLKSIPNPHFVLGYVALATVVVIVLNFLNTKRLRHLIERAPQYSFIKHLEPLELVYLKTGNIAEVIHGSVNNMYSQEKISLHKDHTISIKELAEVTTIEEHTILENIKHLSTPTYKKLLATLLRKHAFKNLKSSMDAMLKHIVKSQYFGWLFYTNFTVYAVLVMIGLSRIETGRLNGKPIVQITFATIVIAVTSAILLYQLTTKFRKIVSGYYREKLQQSNSPSTWDQQYFTSGDAALATGFLLIVNRSRESAGYGGDYSSTSSCSSGDSSGGGSCGSSCSSCGGCGGD